MWCVPKLNREYIERMEDVLNTLAKPPTPAAPVIALDERPVQLLDSKRIASPMAPGRVARQDYEYVRKGVANTYCIVAPHEGRHLTHATPNRKALCFAQALTRVSKAYPRAKTIHLIVDNLNIHREKSLVDALGAVAGRRLWRRFTVHYTPKHGSWLNPAEIECGLLSRECLGDTRVSSLAELRARVSAWNRTADHQRRKIRWRFKTTDARRVFRYRRRSSTASGSRH